MRVAPASAIAALYVTLAAAIGLGAILGTIATPARAQTPGTRTLPPGDGRDLAAAACSQCHTLNVIMSMREGAAGWRKHVTNMVMRGAQLNPREVDTVIAYFTANFGPGSPVGAPVASGPAGSPAATVASFALPAGPGKELVETRCTLCHTLERVTIVKRGKAQWPDLVANMVGRGAPASPQEAQIISSYLAANFGGE